jgi:glycosyltransferase involved in cell wall biosynthesis
VKEADPQSFSLHIAYLTSKDDLEFDLHHRARKLGIDNFVKINETSKFDWRSIQQLSQLLKERAIDILHCHCYKSDVYGLILARLHDIKLVTTAHGPLASLRHFWTAQNWRARYVYDQLDLRLLRYFDHVLVVAESMRKTISHFGVKKDKLTYVKNAIDSQFFRRRGSCQSELREQLGVPTGGVVIGAVGRLNAEKDYPNFFQAAKLLLKERQDLHFVIAGKGPLEAKLQKQAEEMGLADRIRFLGHFHDVRQVYEMLDMYVLSSTREGLPNTVLEAMAMEVPIVATDVDGVGEAVRHDREALLVPARAPERLAEGIRAVLTNEPLGSRLRQAARARVTTEFSFARRMRRVEGIYRSVMGVSAARPAQPGRLVDCNSMLCV